LHADGIDCSWERVDTENDFRKALLRTPDLIISDGSLPQFDGRLALQIVRAEAPQIPLIFFSGAPWDHRAQEALEAGAAAFICKADRRQLASVVRRVCGIGTGLF
jgi:DNA-binding NarL/FixJ family response regulator